MDGKRAMIKISNMFICSTPPSLQPGGPCVVSSRTTSETTESDSKSLTTVYGRRHFLAFQGKESSAQKEEKESLVSSIEYSYYGLCVFPLSMCINFLSLGYLIEGRAILYISLQFT